MLPYVFLLLYVFVLILTLALLWSLCWSHHSPAQSAAAKHTLVPRLRHRHAPRSIAPPVSHGVR